MNPALRDTVYSDEHAYTKSILEWGHNLVVHKTIHLSYHYTAQRITPTRLSIQTILS